MHVLFQLEPLQSDRRPQGGCPHSRYVPICQIGWGGKQRFQINQMMIGS